MDDLKLDVLPEDDAGELDRMRAQGKYKYARKTCALRFEHAEVAELIRMLESIAVDSPNYSRVSEAVIFAEKIRRRWKME